MTTETSRRFLKSLEDPEYRRIFVDEHVSTGLAFQIRQLREDREWTQEQLAQRTGKAQETISLWENPDYGRYSLRTLKDLAAAFDVALLVRFAPFTDLASWVTELTPERLAPPNFDKERSRAPAVAGSVTLEQSIRFALEQFTTSGSGGTAASASPGEHHTHEQSMSCFYVSAVGTTAEGEKLSATA